MQSGGGRRPGKRLDADERFRAELGYCVEHALPFGHFQGGPPVWRQADRDYVVEYQRWRSEFCPSCGTRERDWRDERTGRLIHPPPLWLSYSECIGCRHRHEAMHIEGQEPEPWETVHFAAPPNREDAPPPVRVAAQRALIPGLPQARR